ncbi:hypothetical protein NDU88_002566 [Pleurodeles waltl]|uniref:Uncharacterized protein n=1 Tax=Pleurodeles waltl TaxID=8319 RepID=A0AAV7UVZ5_PLEWA|nr:hypothetical protein NDU88_002566 [Pleurodeles waltl]
MFANPQNTEETRDMRAAVARKPLGKFRIREINNDFTHERTDRCARCSISRGPATGASTMEELYKFLFSEKQCNFYRKEHVLTLAAVLSLQCSTSIPKGTHGALKRDREIIYSRN